MLERPPTHVGTTRCFPVERGHSVTILAARPSPRSVQDCPITTTVKHSRTECSTLFGG